MRYNYDMIAKLQANTGVDLETAEKCYKKSRGNYNKAEYLAKKKLNSKKTTNKYTGKISDIFSRFVTYRLIVTKGGVSHINVPMWMVLLIMFLISIFNWNELDMFIIIFFVTLLFGIEYKIVCAKQDTKEKINVEPLKKKSDGVEHESDEMETVYDLSKEEVESDENGFVKVEIGK